MAEQAKRRPGRPTNAERAARAQEGVGNSGNTTPTAPRANGETVAAFEAAFAKYVGAKYAIALTNGTVTLQVALHALGLQPGQPVAVPPLTMASTSMAVLLAGGAPQYVDVDPDTWLMQGTRGVLAIPVSLYGAHYPHGNIDGVRIDDAAQTLRKHDPRAAFTSYSFQASKILALGEGGMLVTDDVSLATAAREYSSLGYRMRPDQPRIDPATLKDPAYLRHYSIGLNARMNDLTAAEGLRQLAQAGALLASRKACAALYRQAIAGCPWLTPQRGEPHDAWAFAVTLEPAGAWHAIAGAIVRHGGESPYAAWRVTYQEPAFRHLAPDGTCPVAERLQARIMAFQTNDRESAERNASALAKTIKEIGG